MNDIHLGGKPSIRMPPVVRNEVFHVTSTMLKLLQMKGLFGGLVREDSHNHIRDFVDIFGLLSFKNTSQESVRIRLFPFSIVGEATKWLANPPRDSKTTWD